MSDHAGPHARFVKLLPAPVQPLAIFASDLLLTHQYTRLFTALFLLAEAVLLLLIIRYVRFTEIDFETYLQQAELYLLKGVRDYHDITGDTGPCVYPAGHLYVYSWFLRIVKSYEGGAEGAKGWILEKAGLGSKAASEQGRAVVQYLFAGIYLYTFAVVMDIYRMAAGTVAPRTHGSKSKTSRQSFLLRLLGDGPSASRAFPPILHLITFLMSKRLHSIYVLRLFNDPIAMALFYTATWLLCKRAIISACVIYSLALSIKMNLLLFLPAWATVMFRMHGFLALAPASLIPLIQAILAYPFLKDHPLSYLSQAFDFSRQFLYKWTVNWRFVPEDIFLSALFARSLLLAHEAALYVFVRRRWTEWGGKGLWRWLREDAWGCQAVGRGGPTPRFIATSLFTCNLIGITFSRSLHYQFFSWYAHQIPFLLWCAELPLVVKILIPLAMSNGWETFPSTNTSSTLLFAAHLTLLWGLWNSKDNDVLIDGIGARVQVQHTAHHDEQQQEVGHAIEAAAGNVVNGTAAHGLARRHSSRRARRTGNT